MINTQLSLASDSEKISLKLGNSIGKLIGILTNPCTSHKVLL